MKKIYSLILVLLWMLFIFIMSSFDADASGSQSGYIVSVIASIFKIKNVILLSFIVRKMAHFLEYFILGILVYNFTLNYKMKYYLGIILCIIYAISDEVHQMFVIGRSGEIRDILIDSMGSIISICLLRKFFKTNK